MARRTEGSKAIMLRSRESANSVKRDNQDGPSTSHYSDKDFMYALVYPKELEAMP